MKLSVYVSIAIFVFVGFLITFAPASILWSIIEPDVARAAPGLNIKRVGGSIWNGKSEFQYRQFPPSHINWDISPLNSLNDDGVIKFFIEGNGHSLELEADVAPSTAWFKSSRGNISSDYLNGMSEQYGLTFSGNLSFSKLLLVIDNAKIIDAAGQVHWSGGKVVVPSQSQPLDLPPLDGELFFEEQLLILDVTFQQLSIIKISLNEHGWATIAIKGRFFDIANLTRPDSTDPDETILLLEEKIL
jgi:hypothetical protein